ncbi:conserved hypothetical protein [Thermocrinis albus DSM 14484]|uniref:Cardiolipin synthase N-terminal domain-containing protein n=1 Tax=Thermocrinis albus (strain DSM 14484 / JCM 11386 / HI 11/12) TaxID=638303 RepID=D3SMC9_THEAH|nr:PLDc N-terminal domain-containing protein [Thermocrinis albus]ADC89909.1 conserved hypothetical protein [Thermocrinis albus DSM 14484]
MEWSTKDFALSVVIISVMAVLALLAPKVLVVSVVILWIILWVIAIIDVLKSEFTGSNKIVWILVLILIPIIGVIAYSLIGEKQKVKE